MSVQRAHSIAARAQLPITRAGFANLEEAERPRGPTPHAARDAFVTAMRGTASGVNVVTTDGPAGRFGLTVSAFCSVSADPPMVLVCINSRSPACAAVRENGQFRVNVLGARQRDLADSFAGRSANGASYDFSSADWQDDGRGMPALVNALASFGCRIDTTVTSGTHLVFVGRVLDVRNGVGQALLYTDRTYGRPCTGGEFN